MKTVYKFGLPITRTATIEMPTGAIIRHVGEQKGGLFLWAEVDPFSPTEKRTFRIAGTGHEIEGNYLGTAQVGELVLHVYEK